MARFKERKKVIHQSDTKEYFISLSSMPIWSKILAENTDKPYKSFLLFLLDKNYYNEREERIMIKKIAADFGNDTSKISKWLKQIYEDIIELNSEKPELFKTEGIRHSIHCRNYDNYCNFTVWLLTTPRQYETFDFKFAMSSTGSNRFYVENVEHDFDKGEHNLSIHLKGGFVNRYRELLLDRAEFYNVISLFDTFHKHDYEIDEELRKFYKH